MLTLRDVKPYDLTILSTTTRFKPYRYNKSGKKKLNSAIKNI